MSNTDEIRKIKVKIRAALETQDFKSVDKLQKKMMKLMASKKPSEKPKSPVRPIINFKAKKKPVSVV